MSSLGLIDSLGVTCILNVFDKHYLSKDLYYTLGKHLNICFRHESI
jgi:hypothetical protein